MLQSKLPNQSASIFSVMTALANQHQAINLSQGFPEFNPPQPLVDAVSQAMRDGQNQYAPMPGILTLRQVLANRLTRWQRGNFDPESEITIVPGATAALFAVFQAFIHAGDEVILFDPSYDSYAPAIKLAGGIPIRIPLLCNDFSMPWQAIKDSLSPKTKMVVINTPHNPLGKILSRTDFIQLSEILSQSAALVLSDEVYEHMVFDEKIHHSVLQVAALKHKSIAISSFGKTFHATGWKLGYITASKELTSEIRKIYQFMAFAANTPMQVAAAQFLTDFPDYEQTVSGLMQSKRDLFVAALAASRFKLLPCEGAYFQVADYSEISALSDLEFAEKLTIEHKIAAVPVSAFYQQAPTNQRLLRFCFAKNNDTLQKSAEILCRL